MDWQVQSVVIVTELAAGFILFRFFIPFFRRIKTGKFDLYIGDRFKKDGSEPKFAGVVMLITSVLGLTAGLIGKNFKDIPEVSRTNKLPVYAACGAVVLTVCALGTAQDYHKETKRGTGLKKRWVLLTEFVVCLGFSYIAKITGIIDTKLLLPFHWGNIELGFIFYPLTAVLMIVIINLVQLHDCPGGVAEYGCDGLCAVSVLVFSLSVACIGAVYPWLELPQMLGIVTAGSCAAFLVWGISPSKIYLGQSGSMMLGAMTALITVTTNLPLIFLTGGIVFIADGVCTLTGYIVFKKKKQLLFQGLTLHGHLSKRGWSDYKIMGASALVTLLGAVGVFFYISYGDSILLNK
ncbi:MAG: hypothetical protein ILA17_10985 [Ruminococcus sp.]|nr:hypothetical protein [Ruminococcus sp.]